MVQETWNFIKIPQNHWEMWKFVLTSGAACDNALKLSSYTTFTTSVTEVTNILASSSITSQATF